MVSQVNTAARQQPSPTINARRSFVVTLSALFVVGGIATVVFRRTSAQRTASDVDHDTDSQTPSGILVRQLRWLESRNGEEELDLRTALGNTYREEGHYGQAETQYSHAHEIAVKLGGSERLVNVLLSRGFVRLQRGHLSAARTDFDMAHAHVDEEHAAEQAVDVLHRLGDAHCEQGKIADSIEVLEKANQMARKHMSGAALGSKLAMLATATGKAYARKGQTDEALVALNSALNHLAEIRRDPIVRWSVNSDPQLAVANTVLGNVLHHRGDSSQAMDLYRKALREQVKSLRPDHPDLVSTRMSIARAHRDMGDSDKAMEALEAVEQTIRAGSQEGPDLARVLIVKADLLREAKRYDESTQSITQALEHQGKCFAGEPTPDVAVGLNTYGSLLHDQGKYDEALNNYKRALELNMQTVGYEDPETAATHNSIGTLLQDMGDGLSAQEHFEKCLDIQQKTVGGVSSDIATTYNNLGTLLYRRGELDDAAKLFGKALEVLDEVGASEKLPDRGAYKENLDEVMRLIRQKSHKSGSSETGLHV